MKMEIKLVCRETVKPSVPTPDHLQTFSLSFFDQTTPPMYVSVILFYANEEDNNNQDNNNIDVQVSADSLCRRRLDLIKRSFAETLSKYYPFAGRIHNNSFVDCNDEGVEYVEAKVSNCRLSQFMQHPDINELANQFLPWNPFGSPDGLNLNVLAGVKVTISEECGGIVLSGCFSHKIADISSIYSFFSDWASTARGASCTDDNGHNLRIKQQQDQQGPDLNLLRSLFPPKDELKVGFMNKMPGGGGGHYIIQGQTSVKVRKFVFGTSKIAELKQKCTTNDSNVVVRTSGVVAVSALLWRCFIDVDIANKKKEQEGAATTDGIDNGRVYALHHVVNLRTRNDPPLPANAFGSMVGEVVASLTIPSINNTNNEDEIEFSNLVRKIGESIKTIDNEYIKETYRTAAQPMDTSSKEVIQTLLADPTVRFNFGSWCGFKIYEKTDFGWGKPTWIGGAAAPFMNMVRLVDSRDGGIEALVTLSKPKMAEFERHSELLAYIDS